MKFKEGDKVIIRKDLKYKTYDGMAFVGEMNKFKGKEMTIIRVWGRNPDIYYHLKEDKECWGWTAKMFIPVEIKEWRDVL